MEIISFNKTKLRRDRFVYPLNDGWIKPIGGLWGSTYTPDGLYISAWKEWCDRENYPCSDSGIIFNLKQDANIYTIDSYEDLSKLAEKYALNNSFLFSLDYERIRTEIDAIHLTDRGQCRTRLSRPYSLYGWDCESWLILSFDAIEKWRRYDEN